MIAAAMNPEGFQALMGQGSMPPLPPARGEIRPTAATPPGRPGWRDHLRAIAKR